LELKTQIILISYQIEICPKKSNQSSTDTEWHFNNTLFWPLYLFFLTFHSPHLSIILITRSIYSGLQKLSSHSTSHSFFLFFFPAAGLCSFKILIFLIIFLYFLIILIYWFRISNAYYYQCYFHLIKARDRNIIISFQISLLALKINIENLRLTILSGRHAIHGKRQKCFRYRIRVAWTLSINILACLKGKLLLLC